MHILIISSENINWCPLRVRYIYIHSFPITGN